MNSITSFFYWVILICIFGFQASALKSQNSKIYWNENTQLEFSDFRGYPTYRSAAAMSYCGIKYNSCGISKNPTYSVSAYFEPKNSWVWSNYKYDYVINHERLHFDIAEIYARKLRKYFAENQVSIRNSKRVYQQFFKAYEQFQNTYDEATQHGTNKKKQSEWKEKIKNELHQLNRFAENRCY